MANAALLAQARRPRGLATEVRMSETLIAQVIGLSIFGLYAVVLALNAWAY